MGTSEIHPINSRELLTLLRPSVMLTRTEISSCFCKRNANDTLSHWGDRFPVGFRQLTVSPLCRAPELESHFQIWDPP